MSNNSTIEWTDATWNPVTGCTEVSPGCDHCYAKTFAERWRGTPGHSYEHGFDLTLRPERLDQPLRWRRPRRIFVNSMSDLFHDGVPDEFIARVWAVMHQTPRHTYQVLTKRHGRMRSLLNLAGFTELVQQAIDNLHDDPDDQLLREPWPPSNVWLGVSVESQQWADIRVPALLGTPAAVRWLSCEPLLGPVDLWQAVATSRYACHACEFGTNRGDCNTHRIDRLDWVVVGGESGHGARPMHPDWARSLRDQCTAADVPYFFKQWGEWGPAPWSVKVCDPDIGWQGTDDELAAAKADSERQAATHSYARWAHLYGHEPVKADHKPWSLERCKLPPEQAGMRHWGKKAAGRELDGRTWDEYPRVAGAVA